jgi:hypothetical protein
VGGKTHAQERARGKYNSRDFGRFC